VLLPCSFGVGVCPRMVNGADRVTFNCSIYIPGMTRIV
jgi:hypothetical protein